MTSPTSQGVLYIVSAPSGAGKTSLVKALLKNDPAIRLSVSYTTRAARPGEVDGRDYHFVDRHRFEADAGRRRVSRTCRGVRQLLRHFKRQHFPRPQRRARHPAGNRLAGRRSGQAAFPAIRLNFHPAAIVQCACAPVSRAGGQDSEEVIERRLAAAAHDVAHAEAFDYIIVNDDFDHALLDLVAITRSVRLEAARQLNRHAVLFDEFRRI